ncbi:MAG: peptide-methionine (R)-S-oxide reductase MsrB [Gammaproteobacteria bacterium]|nr:peptide-methionine (R)-S-oxide reductase MsrB [Gammaproteobacteria bacterium]
MNRRRFLAGVTIVTLAPMGLNINAGDKVKPSGGFKKIHKSEEEWRELLTDEEFEVLRDEATEQPGSSRLNDEKRAGIYVCAACALPLFKSQWKFESGTGWPSFYTAIKDHVETKTDYGLFWPRTEYHCARCGGHQGHVFDDGQQPTGQRWCNNGVALDFKPA